MTIINNPNSEPHRGLTSRRSFLKAVTATVIGAPVLLESATNPSLILAADSKLTQDLGGFDLMQYCQDRFGSTSMAVLTKPEIGANVAYDNWQCTDGSKRRDINMNAVARSQYDERPIEARPLNPDGANTWHAFTKPER